jgi:hypothetical protein
MVKQIAGYRAPVRRWYDPIRLVRMVKHIGGGGEAGRATLPLRIRLEPWGSRAAG